MCRSVVVWALLLWCGGVSTSEMLPRPLARDDAKYLGVPGIYLSGSSRDAAVQQSTCLCTSSNCGCSDSLACSQDGLCRACSLQDCRFYGNSGCSCGLGTACSQTTGTCVTSTGTVPSQCAGLSCITGQGSPVWDGTACVCQCGTQYSGTNCGSCAYGYTSYPTCTSQTGAGSNCQSTYCQNNGAAFWTSSGVCTCQCQTGYSGTFCDSCAVGYSGYPTCVSTYSQSCSTLLCQNNGQPYWSVSQSRCFCSCQPGYGGDTCGLCAAGYTNYPTCTGASNVGQTACTTTTCGAYGTGYWDGLTCRCICTQGYSGSACTECAVGFVGYPTCVVSTNFGVGGVTPATPLPTTATVVAASSDDDNTGLIVALIVGLILLLLICLALCLYFAFFRKKKVVEEKYQPSNHSEPGGYPVPAPPVFVDSPQKVTPPASIASTPAAISVVSEHDAPLNPINQDFPPPQSHQSLSLTKENAEYNNFMHRRDGTFA